MLDVLTEYVLDVITWQHPSTIIDQWYEDNEDIEYIKEKMLERGFTKHEKGEVS